MAEERSEILIGVDGGGTGCRVAVLHAGQRSEATGAAANVSSDFPSAIKALQDTLTQAATKLALTPSQLRSARAVLGLAGVLDAAMAERVAGALPLDRVDVYDDRRTALAGALGGGDGSVVGLGTGSFLARKAGETEQYMGGYGLILGDEASGAWLGRGLLVRCLHAADGLVPTGPLARSVLAEFGAPDRIVAFASAATPAEFGGFAPRIFAAAEAGDPDACELVAAGADYVARSLKTLGWQAGERVCLIGGVGPRYLPYLDADIAASVRPPEGTSLDGALRLAAQMPVGGKTA